MKIRLNFFLFSLLFMLAMNLNAQEYFTDPEDLQDAVNNANNGGTFIVTDGTYNDFEATFEIVASEDNPIIIKAETVGGVLLTGESHFVIRQSAYVTLQGFVFDGQGEDSLVKLEGSNHIRITRNVFELETTESIKWVFVGGVWNDNTYPFQYPSHHNRIDHNIFQNKDMPGHYITLDGSFDDTSSDEVYYQSQFDTIDYNYFRNNGPRAVNEQETIRIGWSEMSESSGFTIVEHNLFEDCDGDPEIISVKSCDNIVRHNTFLSSYGTVTLRHGNRNVVEGNFFFGNGKPIGESPAGSALYTGGIRIYGTDHLIINNYMEGLNGTRWDAPITLTLGDAIDGQSSNLSKHFRAERVTIAYNTLVNNSHGIEIGYDNNDNYNKDLKDITIANNLITGSENSLVEIVESGNDQGDEISWLSNLMFPTEGATILEGATSTSFDAAAVTNENPFLDFDNSYNIWSATSSTPLYEYTLPFLVTHDIEGQERPFTCNPGADHFSLDSVWLRPLTAADVGPNAYSEFTTSTAVVTEFSKALLFPVPTNQSLYFENINPNLSKVELVNLEGKVVLTYKIENREDQLSIDVSSISNGIYIVRLFSSDRIESQKILVQH